MILCLMVFLKSKILKGFRHGLSFSKEGFVYMKIKTAGCFQNGKYD